MSRTARQKQIYPLTPGEVRRLIDAASAESASGVRLRALIAVLYGSGLRISEALALKPGDIEGNTVRVHRGKGGKSRTVGIDHSALAILAPWLERRKALGLNGRHTIFASYSAGHIGQPMDDEYARQALTRLTERAGIDKRVTPHIFRHSMAVDMERKGYAISAIQMQLGHTSLAVTTAYLAHLSNHELVESVSEREW